MRTGFNAKNTLDEKGNPTGGHVIGLGIYIYWQNGPLGRGDDRKLPNGAFIEDVIAACVDRLRFYETTRFACANNVDAIFHLESALEALAFRTKEREDRFVEGLHEE